MKRLICTVLCIAMLFMNTACGAGRMDTDTGEPSGTILEIPSTVGVISVNTTDSITASIPKEDNEFSEEDARKESMKVEVNGSVFYADLEENEAAAALSEMMQKEPVVIQMSDYSGFEKVGVLGKSLPADNSRITTQAGDIVLYQGNQIVIFYGSNTWSYTKIGKIIDLAGWEEALGGGDVTVTFSLVSGGEKASSDTSEASSSDKP